MYFTLPITWKQIWYTVISIVNRNETKLLQHAYLMQAEKLFIQI